MNVQSKKWIYSPQEYRIWVQEAHFSEHKVFPEILFTPDYETIPTESKSIHIENPPFLINESIKNKVLEIKKQPQTNREKLNLLMDIAFMNPSDILYDSSYTLSAMACYELRSCNCFGITNLMVGITRAAGFDSKYVLVEDQFNSDDILENTVYTNHIACELTLNNQTFVIDTDQIEKKFRMTTTLSDIEAAGLFYSNIAAKYLKANLNQQAIEILLIAAEMYPDSFQIENNLGACYLKLNNPDKAVQHFKNAVTLTKYPETIMGNIYKALSQSGKTDQFKEIIRNIKNIQERNPHYIIRKKVTPMIRKHQYSQALFYLKQAEEVGKNIGEVYHLKSICYLKLGQDALAKKSSKKAAILGFKLSGKN